MKSSLVIAVLIFLAVGVVASCSAAPTLTFQPGSVSVVRGGTATVNLVLNEAPEGLAGYDAVVRVVNPGIGEISGVSYPPWAELHNTTTLSDGGIRISAVDTQIQVGPGAAGITLATLTIRGLTAGSSQVTVSSVNMDADGGGMITPTLASATLIVTGTGGNSGGGSGGGGGSYYPSTTTQPTPISTVTETVTTAPTTQPIPTGETVSGTPTGTGDAGVVHSMDTPVVPGPDDSSGEPGFPWSWIIGAVVIIVAANLIAVAFMKMRQRKE